MNGTRLIRTVFPITCGSAFQRFFHSKSVVPTSVNTMPYINPEADATIEAAEKTFDVKEQDRLLGKLHEIIVDLALAFQLKDIFESYISHVNDHYKVRAGLVTRNFPRLIQLLDETGISYDKISLMTPFNKMGFQMNPSREACERSLAQKPGIDVMGMSILAAGMLNLKEATEYIHGLENLRSVVVGVSSEDHAVRTFQTLRNTSTLEAPIPQRAPEVLARN